MDRYKILKNKDKDFKLCTSERAAELEFIKVLSKEIELCSVCRRPHMAGLRDDHLVLVAVQFPITTNVTEVSTKRGVQAERIPESELVIEHVPHLHPDGVSTPCRSMQPGICLISVFWETGTEQEQRCG